MNKKIGLCSLFCIYIFIAIGMGGCIGYAGSVGPSSGSAKKSNPGSVAATPGSVSFGSVAIGSSSSQSVSLTNPSRAAVVISNLISSNAAFVPSGLTFPLNLAPGQSAAFHVGFQPRTSGDFQGTITVASNASGSATLIGVSGSSTQKQQPGVIAASTATLSLGSVVVGSAGTQTFSVTNTGGMTAILSSVNSSSPAFAAAGPNFPMDVAPGQTVPFTVTFTPAATGNASGVITVGSNASNAPTTVAVSGTGTATPTSSGTLSANPSTVSIGNVSVGSTGSQSFSVTNTGSKAVNISAITSSAATFAASGPTLPMSLAAGQSVSVKVAFAPTAAGNAKGTIAVVSDASNTPTSVAVSGSGVTAATAPTISAQPANQTVVAGQKATFSVTASGTGSLNYQWENGGTVISGATSASYTTGATTSADNGASFTVTVSNSAGSVTSNAATLTVTAATLSLSANPTSLSFGSINVGSNSSQSVTFTNNGNSDVTVSKVSVSGAGFNATGISAGQVVAAGKTASLSVTFAPSGSGSLTGSVTVTSNAANSPLTVALSGTGASTVPPAVSGAPTCGKNNDTTVHVPADWQTFAPPAKGKSYVDPTFGCTVTRITDASSEDWQPTCNGGAGCYMPLNMGYATVSPFNANDSYLMLADGWNNHFVTDLSGNIVIPMTSMPAQNDGWTLWDASNPNVFYYTHGNSLMKGTISGASVTNSSVHQFTEYSTVNFMDETDVSQDGEHVVIVGGDSNGSSPENIFDYDFITNVKGAVYTTGCTGTINAPNNGCLHKLIQTPDNNVIIQFANDGSGAEQGNRLWTGGLNSDALTALTYLLPLQNATNHLDSGADMNGNPVFVEIGNSSVLSGETNPCPSGWGTDVRMIYNPLSSVCLVDSAAQKHVSYRGNANQPWITISYFDAANSSPEWFGNSSHYAAPNASNWYTYEDEITAVRVDANNNPSEIYRLARAYSRSDEDFFSQPHGSISRDGRYIAFNSNMAYAQSGCPAKFQTSTGCTDVYVIKVK